jgi:archaellin
MVFISLALLTILLEIFKVIENFDNQAYPWFDSRSPLNSLFEGTDDSLKYNDSPGNLVVAVNNNNSKSLNDSEISKIDPNLLSVQELQELVKKEPNEIISYDPGNILLETSYLSSAIQTKLQKFNKEKGQEYSILGITNAHKNANNYFFDAFLSESKINSNMQVSIALSLDYSRILELKSKFISIDSDLNIYTPISNETKLFLIKNELGLFYPYPTSREELVINKTTTDAYKAKVEELSIKTGSCFGAPGAINFTNGADCTRSGGVWKLFM